MTNTTSLRQYIPLEKDRQYCGTVLSIRNDRRQFNKTGGGTRYVCDIYWADGMGKSYQAEYVSDVPNQQLFIMGEKLCVVCNYITPTGIGEIIPHGNPADWKHMKLPTVAAAPERPVPAVMDGEPIVDPAIFANEQPPAVYALQSAAQVYAAKASVGCEVDQEFKEGLTDLASHLLNWLNKNQ